MQNLISLLGYLLAIILLACSAASCNLGPHASYVSEDCMFCTENRELTEPYNVSYNPNTYAIVRTLERDTVLRYYGVSYLSQIITAARTAILLDTLGYVEDLSPIGIKLEVKKSPLRERNIAVITKTPNWDNARGYLWTGPNNLCRDTIAFYID